MRETLIMAYLLILLTASTLLMAEILGDGFIIRDPEPVIIAKNGQLWIIGADK